MSNINDPYQLRPEEVSKPPETFFDTLKRIGPGIILAASIVGRTSALPQSLHRIADGDSGDLDSQPYRSGSDGSNRWNLSGDDVARHRPGRGLPSSPPSPERH